MPPMQHDILLACFGNKVGRATNCHDLHILGDQPGVNVMRHQAFDCRRDVPVLAGVRAPEKSHEIWGMHAVMKKRRQHCIGVITRYRLLLLPKRIFVSHPCEVVVMTFDYHFDQVQN